MSLAIGSRLGSYKVLQLIGAGGMGEVYRARDTKLDRDVALKVLPDAVATDAERLARFEREAKTLAALNHPHIAHVYGFEDGSTLEGVKLRAIVMELVDGEDLAQVISRGAVGPQESIAIAGQIADALEAAHEQGIVHRDLKPANIKVRADGTVKVLDFGLAKAFDPVVASSAGSLAPTITTPAMTHAGVVLGTAAYMSPEQAKGKFVDRRTDIWAFGALLYEMLTATRAFEGEDVTDTIVALISQEPDWSRLPASTPGPIRALLRRCLEKDARRRLRDIGEARILVADVQSGRIDTTPALQEVAGRAQPLWRRAMPVAAAVVMTSIVGIAAWSQFAPETATPASARLVVPLDEDWQWVRTGGRMIAFSPDGSRLVYIGNGQLYVRPIDSFESTVIAGSAKSDPADPFFSPDGQWVGYYSVRGSALKKIAVAGGTPVTVASFEAPTLGVFQGGEWSGDTIYYAEIGRGIMRVSASGGKPEVVIAVPPPASAFGPQILPNGAILFSETADETSDRWDKAETVVVQPATGVRKTVLRGATAARYLPSGHLVHVVGGTLNVVPFDVESLEVTGSAVTMFEDVRRVTYSVSGAAQFAVSSAGHLAYIPGATARAALLSMFLLDLKGGIQPLAIPAGYYQHPRISPDGKQFTVATTGSEDQVSTVWVADLAPGASLRRVSFGGDGSFPAWSRDGRSVFYTSTRNGQRGVYRQAVDGSGAPERVFTSETLRSLEHIHPDGQTLLVGTTANNGDIGQVTPDGVYTPLIEGRGVQGNASFSPDGRWLAYSSADGGLTQLFVTPYPRNGAVYQITTATGSDALWTPDGDRLIFQTALAMNEVDQMASVTLQTSAGFTFGAPVPLDSARAKLGAARATSTSPRMARGCC